MKYPGIIKCLRCEKILVSFDRHDFKKCGCPNNTMIDGGYDYLKCGGVDIGMIKVLRITTARKTKLEHALNHSNKKYGKLYKKLGKQ